MKRLAYIRGLTSFSSATELESVTLQAIGEEIIMYIHEREIQGRADVEADFFRICSALLYTPDCAVLNTETLLHFLLPLCSIHCGE